jgi:hypothetical protein
MPAESKQISASIDRSAADVYRYASDPANVPAWAPGSAAPWRTSTGTGSWETPAGRAGFAFAERNEFGVLNHELTLPSGDVIDNPMRVVPNGDGCEVVFTLRRLPDMSDEDFERDAGLVQADLTRLKQLMEAAR